jgi:hypothetical protein
MNDNKSSLNAWPAAYDRRDHHTHPRIAFVKAMEAVAPEALQALFNDLLPSFKRIQEKYRIDLQDVNIPWLRFFHPMPYFQLSWDLKPDMVRWINRFHLAGPDKVARLIRWRPYGEFPELPPLYYSCSLWDWVQPLIVDTLGMWAAGQVGTPLRWCFDHVGRSFERMFQISPPDFNVQIAAWSLLDESRPDFSARANLEFQKRLKRYIQERMAHADAQPLEREREWQEARDSGWRALKQRKMADLYDQGLERLPERYAPCNFEWLALFQVGELSINKIATATEVDPRVISQGVRRAAKAVIGCAYRTWLRRSKPGRPRKP